jgi:serine/threonine protein kinase
MAIPDRIGKYEISRQLGEGATSIVYLGFDPFAKREVAVKAIFPEVLRDKERGKLYRNLLMTEASLAGKLNHPHIVQIFDAVLPKNKATSSWNTSRAARWRPSARRAACSPWIVWWR